LANHNDFVQPIKPQSHIRFPLTRLLASGGAVRVLRALFLYGGPLSVSQIASDTGMTPQGIRATLDTLVGQQIVTVLGQGRSTLYAADMRHPMAPALQALFIEEREHFGRLLQAIKDVMRRNEIEAAWYYGSVARADDTPASDFDIAVIVVGDVDAVIDDLRQQLHGVESSYAVTFSVIGIAIDDVAAMAAENAWWGEMAHDAKVIKGVLPDRLAKHLRRAA